MGWTMLFIVVGLAAGIVSLLGLSSETTSISYTTFLVCLALAGLTFFKHRFVQWRSRR